MPSPEQRLLRQVLRGELASWPAATEAGFDQRFLDACLAQEVELLVHHQARSSSAWQSWPASVRDRLARAARMQTAQDMLRERELIGVLDAFAAVGIGTLLLKGAALAYTHYVQSALRPRCDTDVLIAPADRAGAERVLEALGYRRPNAVSGTLVSYEDLYRRSDGAVEHVIDLHWQVNNAQVFAQALSHDEMHARSVPVPQLGESARTLYPPHALLLACMHRAAHLGTDGAEGNRLIWLYDIHLLATDMTAVDWPEFAKICVERQMRGITLDAFACTHEALGTEFPAGVVQQLRASAPDEISAAYLNADRARLLLTDLRALPAWRERATLLRETCFPPADYVLAKYRTRRRWLLPWLYVRRAVEGGRKFLRS